MTDLPIQHTPQTFKFNINKADGFLSRDNYPAVGAFRLKAAGAAVGRLRRGIAGASDPYVSAGRRWTPQR